jgi:hypothetical protein
MARKEGFVIGKMQKAGVNNKYLCKMRNNYKNK